ncbi:MAG: hypothetical protein ABIQ04_04230 [Candidatus Saccharimonadales bacterium]
MEQQRPTKKQRELLSFIDGFIKGTGYGPSYREVMRALEYKSVSTVATHIDGLITRGFLRKTTHSARSLEMVIAGPAEVKKTHAVRDSHIAWLKSEVDKRADETSVESQQQLEVLKGALNILDQPEAEQV